ncbi:MULTISPECIES: rod shape-determining protein [Paraburkholderia]|uniref:Cell shape-determining protein MreB n=2 Tax=Paraburkholderia TaxID=1822464 RepID=A0A1A5XBY8_9BURK|nr:MULTISPECIES: rod shape-determining protein [Paraburkholderia]OBR51021.1 rod shape-determining protein [Paraburkholderia tropica]QNB13035.1 rod shape-determining protein [Paraburkholderia tropica]RQM50932.1 rod shape-determining protein [Paraburkholderia bannensis]RQN40338.1 rod shape-determining protein [Paraburkholderia tropica]SEJ34245.1 rod shape-determining protein MreB [Paraburkholderia tropica]
MAQAARHSSFLHKLSRHDVALDLGTANTLIYTADEGIVLDQPSVVCFERGGALGKAGETTVAAVGRDAKALVGRAPQNLETVKPLVHGVIADFSAAEHMMRRFVAMAQPRRLFGRRPAFTVCVPGAATRVERRAIREAAFSAGAASVNLIGESLAAALGAGLPVGSSTGSMVVDIGGGTTEVGVIALGAVACSGSIRVGGDQFDRAIIDYVRGLYGVIIGDQTAEHLKKTIGSALRGEPIERLRATGRSLDDGLPRTVEVTSEDIADALAMPLRQVIGVVRQVFETAPPELVTDIADTGIVLTGGGALLGRLDQCLQAELGVRVRIADEPLSCAVRGAGAAAAGAVEAGQPDFHGHD